jgi:hypothetical protein
MSFSQKCAPWMPSCSGHCLSRDPDRTKYPVSILRKEILRDELTPPSATRGTMGNEQPGHSRTKTNQYEGKVWQGLLQIVGDIFSPLARNPWSCFPRDLACEDKNNLFCPKLSLVLSSECFGWFWDTRVWKVVGLVSKNQSSSVSWEGESQISQ